MKCSIGRITQHKRKITNKNQKSNKFNPINTFKIMKKFFEMFKSVIVKQDEAEEPEVQNTASGDVPVTGEPAQDAAPKAENGKVAVNNLIILDKSGSMESIRHAAITGVNETLGGIRSAAKRFADSQEQFVTIVLFCDCELTYLYDHTPIADVKDITPEQYQPCCCTPLYDAMGKSINRLRNQLSKEKDYTVLVTVVTDGLENASKEFSGKAIYALVTDLKTKGWVFNYIGTDHDVESVAKTLNITNIIHFEKSEEDTRATFRREAGAKMNFFSRLQEQRDVMACSMSEADREAMYSALGENFYDAPENEEKDEKEEDEEKA